MDIASTQEDRKSYRIPLVGTEFTRVLSTSSGSSASSGIVGVGVVGSMIVGSLASSAKDQRFVNAIPEHISNRLTGSSAFFVNKRPGFAVLNTPAAGNAGSAIHVWAGKNGTDVISAFGATNSTLYNGVSSIGTTTGVVNFIDDTLVGTTANLVMTTASNSAYFYPNGGALTLISDVDFPSNAGETITGRFVFVDGYSFIMTQSGKIYNSDLNSISSWSASSYISTNAFPDGGIGLAKYKDYIVAFGKSSTEFLKDAGTTTGSPLQRVPDSVIGIGCIAPNAYAKIDDTIAWIGTTDESGIGIYMLEGLQAKKVSTPTIEALLASTNPTGFYLNAIKLGGQTLITVVSTADNRTYVYSVEYDIWHEWSGTTILWQFMVGLAAGIKYVYAVTNLGTGGKVYILNPTAFVFQDDSSNYTFLIQTSKVDLDNQKRKFLHKLKTIGDQQSSSTPLSISYTDDDYQTYSTPRTVDIMNPNSWLAALGSFFRRAFVISYTGANPLRLEALELDISQGYR